ncbi:MAG: DUF2339 domain-containing protein [Gammaproteobacteria bacterium]|nr:DUF2339 domain-containing protein [Gammaproteobacteria bacterium]
MAVTIIATVLGLALGLALDAPLLYGLLGFSLGRVFALDTRLGALDRELTRLREALAADWENRNRAKRAAPRIDAISAGKATVENGSQPGPVPAARPMTGEMGPEPTARPPLSVRQEHKTPRQDAVGASPASGGAVVFARLRDWFNDGNVFVRVGILLLFIGVGFLIKYAVDQKLLVFTLEMRLAAVAVGAFFLLGFGWHELTRKRNYALLLQGAAVGLLYLDVYGAFGVYHLIGSGPAFGLLFLVGALAAALAVLQNAAPLAWFGFAGGFLAPVIASSGSGDHVVLFSYYAFLNAAILAVAWFRSWRALNLLGFAFTWGIAGIWGVLRYEPSRFASTEPFLVLFFLFYIAIAVLYAIRQPPRYRGFVDATLIFGTPTLAFTYQLEIVHHIEFGTAWSAFALGAFYLVLAKLTRRSSWEGRQLLSEAFLAIGIVFLTVAVPFALDAEETTGAWALEGAGLVWIGVRQSRRGARAFGLLLQAGAAVFLVFGYPYPSSTAFLNGPFLAAGMIAIAGAMSAFVLDRTAGDTRPPEADAAPWLLVWALLWWFGAGYHELAEYYPSAARPAGFLTYALITALVAESLAHRWPWGLLHRAETGLPLAGVAAFALSVSALQHPAESGGLWAWPLFLGTCYLVLYRIEQRDSHRSLAIGHVAAALLTAAVIDWEFVWRTTEQLGVRQGWRVAAHLVVPLVLLQMILRVRRWPLEAWADAYRVVAGGVLAAAILIWLIGSAGFPGGSAPLPWFPVINPLDLAGAAVLLTLWQWWQTVRIGLLPPREETDRGVRMLLGSLGFLWVNLVLLRAMHHWAGVPWEANAMFRSNSVQMALAMLWGVSGVSLLLTAKRLGSRVVWVSGATVIAAVVLKLFLIDLAAHGTVERIVSFLAVGGLLVAIGWFSPFPPRTDRGDKVKGPDDKARV